MFSGTGAAEILICSRDSWPSRIRRDRLTKYENILYWSAEDESFIAEVPDLPGCAADCGTRLQALDNVKTVIQE
jgi:hypothetical protein